MAGLTTDEARVFLADAFPQVAEDLLVVGVEPTGATLRLTSGERHLRPGGTVSGPSMFGLADVAVYVALLGRIGAVPLAVTTGASIDFMRKPPAGRDLIAAATLLKVGRTLAVGDVAIRADGDDAILARATMTYSIPPVSAG